jgi:hypothetical protein
MHRDDLSYWALAWLWSLALLLAFQPFAMAQSARPSDPEKAGIEAEQAGRLREAFSDFMAAFQELPTPPPADADLRLRKRIIQVVEQLNPPPAVPEEGERRMIRGQTAIKAANGPEDLKAAAAEFEQALWAAPWLASAYFNLALVREKQKDYAGAIKNYKLYVLAAPNAEDIAAVRRKTIELEYLEEKKPEQEARDFVSRLAGTWVSIFDVGSGTRIKYISEMVVVGDNRLELNPVRSTILSGPRFIMNDPKMVDSVLSRATSGYTSLTLKGLQIEGTNYSPSGKTETFSGEVTQDGSTMIFRSTYKGKIYEQRWVHQR